MAQFKFSFDDVTASEIKVRTIEEAAKEKRSPVLEFIPQSKYKEKRSPVLEFIPQSKYKEKRSPV